MATPSAAEPRIHKVDDVAGIARILMVMAHPDDVDFGSAGSVAAWTAAGIDVAYCIVTDGDAGGTDRTQSRADMAAVRRDEQCAAAAVVGVSDITFWVILTAG